MLLPPGWLVRLVSEIGLVTHKHVLVLLMKISFSWQVTFDMKGIYEGDHLKKYA